MFTLRIVDSDAFLDMPVSSQALYFHLSMRADDDGFIGNPKKIMRIIGAAEDDIKVLITKRFILAFQSGVIVVKHWKMHNYIQNDRYSPTQYVDEKASLKVKENGSYTESIQNASTLEPQVRLGKVRLGEDSNTDTAPKGAEKTKKKETDVQKIVNRFFELKDWANKPKEFYQNNKIIYGRHVKPAKQLLELVAMEDRDIHYAINRLEKLAMWAISREFDWSLETVIKKYLEIDKLTEKEKKPYWKNQPMYQRGGRWWVVTHNGEHLQFMGSLKNNKEVTYA